MNNLTQIPVIAGKVSCEICGQPVLRDTVTGKYKGCSEHFIRMDVEGAYVVFSNFDESGD